jgi:hypothetical protein
MSKKMIWSGQGPVYFGTYDPDNGKPEMGYMTNLFAVGCGTRSLTITPERETTLLKESCTGQRLDMMELETSKSMTVSLSMFQFDREVLARAFFADNTSVADGSVTGEVFHEGITEGGIAFLKHPNASSIVITDDNDDVLVAGTNYTIIDASQGTIRFDDLGTLVQPFKAAYSYTKYGNLTAFTRTNVKTGIIFAGKNQDGDKARVIIPNVSLALSGDFGWITEAEAELTLEGRAMYVPSLSDDAFYGPFMRIDGLPD